MDIYSKVHMLDDLDQLSVENLNAGRITCSAVAHAIRYAEKSYDNFAREKLGGTMGGSSSDRYLADVLNDMFEVAKYKMQEAEKTAGPRCVKCGQSLREHKADGSCLYASPPDPQEKKYKYRVVYHDASGMPVEWLTNKIEQHSDSGIKFQDHNGITRVCFAQYKVTDLTQPDPGEEVRLSAEDQCPNCYPGTLKKMGDERLYCDSCSSVFVTCPNCGRAAQKQDGKISCGGCGAVWPIEERTQPQPTTKPKKKFTMDDLKKVSWDGMAEDVSKRIHLLGSLSLVAEGTPLMDKIVEDLILPNLRLLAEFCENVEIKEEP